MKRLDFLRTKWEESINAKALELDHSLERGKKAFDLLTEADPTAKKIYLDFVMRTYDLGEFLLEDCTRVRETLDNFHKFKSRLPKEMRDIGYYKTERDIWATLNDFDLIDGDLKSGKATKRSDQNRAHLESEVLRDNGWTMVRPNSFFASAWWGMGTRWCTTQSAHFKSYNRMGPLRIVISPDGIKHQIHFATSSFCDATDKRVDATTLLRTLPTSFIAELHKDVEAHAGNLVSDQHATVGSLKALESLPAEFFGAFVIPKIEEILTQALEGTIIADDGGWSLRHANSILARYALTTRLNAPSESFAGFLISPEGRFGSLHFDQPLASANAIEGFNLADRSLEFRLAFLEHWIIYAGGRNGSESARRAADYLASFNEDDVPDHIWKRWAKLIAAYMRIHTRPRKFNKHLSGNPPFVIPAWVKIPHAKITPTIAQMLASRGAATLLSEEILTREMAKKSCLVSISAFEDQRIRDLLTLEDIAEIFGYQAGVHMKLLPEEYKTLAMARLIIAKKPAALRAVEKMVSAQDFNLEGNRLIDIIIELSTTVVEKTPNLLQHVSVALPRHVFETAVRKSIAAFAFMPLTYRTLEISKYVVEHEKAKHVLCHVPQWAIDEIRAEQDGKHGKTGNYKPVQSLAHHVDFMIKPTREAPENAVPVNRLSKHKFSE